MHTLETVNRIQKVQAARGVWGQAPLQLIAEYIFKRLRNAHVYQETIFME